MNAEELAPRLRMLCQFLRFNVKCARRVSLLHRDINAANPCAVHTNVRYDVSTFVSHCDVHVFSFYVLSSGPDRGTGRADRCPDLLCAPSPSHCLPAVARPGSLRSRNPTPRSARERIFFSVFIGALLHSAVDYIGGIA